MVSGQKERKKEQLLFVERDRIGVVEVGALESVGMFDLKENTSLRYNSELIQQVFVFFGGVMWDQK